MTAIRAEMLTGLLCCALVAAHDAGAVPGLLRNPAGTISMIVEHGSLDLSDGNSDSGSPAIGSATT